MTASTGHVRPDVVTFVAAVRGQLADLPAEVVDELTGGLEADLSDLAAESDVPLPVRIGSPAAYADELRSAADLPPRGAVRRGPGHLAGLWRAGLDRVREEPWWPGTRDFLLAIRPAWWVARGLVPAWLAGHMFGSPLFGLLVAAIAVVISVELGRGRWPGRLAGTLTRLANVVAVLCLLAAVVGGFGIGGRNHVGDADPIYGAPGLLQGGEPVTNVFPYDAQGHLLTGVQLFDQDGRPLALDPDALPADSSYADDGSELRSEPVPSVDAYGQQVWNVFPLSTVERRYPADGSVPAPVGSPQPARPHMLTVPPLMGSQADPAGGPTGPAGSPTGPASTTTPTPGVAPTVGTAPTADTAPTTSGGTTASGAPTAG